MRTRLLLAVAALLSCSCNDPMSGGSDAGYVGSDTTADITEDGGSDSLAGVDAMADAMDAHAADAADGGHTGGADVPVLPDVAVDTGGQGDVDAGGAIDTGGVDTTAQDSGGEPDVTTGFDDHSVPFLLSEDDFFDFCSTGGPDPSQCKFVLTRFQDSLGGECFWLSPTFYALHDEWYWFGLLNGVAIDGYPEQPIQGLVFATIAEVVAWASEQTVLPLGLSWYGERLYSTKFYGDSFGAERFFGLGSLLHYEPNPDRVLPEELWLFELEFVDKLTAPQLTVFFQRLSEVLPPSIADQVRWLVRSSSQEALAQAIEAAGGPLAGRIVRYEQLVVAGEAIGYNPGITAGTVRVVPKGAGGGSYQAHEIVVLAEVPDYLPPVAGIVTAVPQTPLAHLNLLAKSRGTPNAYVAGIVDHPGVNEWDKWDAPVILKVSETAVQWHPITKAQLDTWKSLQVTKHFQIPPVDLPSAPLTVDLTQGGLASVSSLVPLCGGKASGFMAFNDYPAIDRPDAPLCITIRAYAEHMESFAPLIGQLLVDPEFTADPLVRFLVLEGAKEFGDQHPDAASAAWLATFEATHGIDTLLGAVVADGGVKGMIRKKPIAAPTLAAITAAVKSRYASFASTQGLRFRSSSTAEDVPGFNGAGLYDSNTGFIEPLVQTDPDDKKKSLSWAILKTWASYWTYEAFEERRDAGIEHLTGNMGLLVHARFDDPMELSNGVVTTYLAQSKAGASFRMVINVQKGDLSVTNPVPGSGSEPEIDVVETWGGAPKIQRVQASTEVEPGAVLLDDARLLWMFDTLRPLTEDWLDQTNAGLAGPQQRFSQILDLEFRHMEEGWPALASGAKNPVRFVFKQVRTLDESQPVPDSIEQLPVPKDVLGQSLKVQRRTCTTGSFVLETVEVYTDPAKSWAFDYSAEPFNGYVTWKVTKDIPGTALVAGQTLTLLHPDFALQAHPFMHHGPWDLYLELTPGAAALAGFESFQIYEWGDWSFTWSDGSFGSQEGSCAVKDLVISPSAYLESLLPAE